MDDTRFEYDIDGLCSIESEVVFQIVDLNFLFGRWLWNFGFFRFAGDQGKNKSRYTKSGLINGRTNAYKKAIVTLKEGDTIDFYSNI